MENETHSDSIHVFSYHYLYHDGWIQIGDNGMHDQPKCRWFHVEERDGEKVLSGYGFTNTFGIYRSQPLMQGNAQTLSGIYKFTKRGIPVKDGMLSWNRLWSYAFYQGYDSDKKKQ